MTDESSLEQAQQPEVNGEPFQGAYYDEYRPGWLERLWRAIGYRRAYAEVPEDPLLPHWYRQEWQFRVPLLLRLLILVSGRCTLRLAGATDAPFDRARANVTLEIEPPGGWPRR